MATQATSSLKDVSRKMAKGAAWMVVARICDRVIGLFSTLILVRVLLPADFGLVAMAISLISMLTLFSSFSFDLALIQHPKAERPHYDTVWTINLLFSLSYGLALFLLARPAAEFYNEPRLMLVMEILAFGMVIAGFNNVGVVAFRKEMQFDKEFKYILSKKLITFTVTVGLALIWRDYWALVAGTLAGMIGGVLLSYALQPYRPRLSLAARHELMRFSKWLFVNNLINFLNNRLPDFVIGRAVGPHSLGLYSVSLEVSNLPTSELAAPVNRAVFPGYSKMASDIPTLREGFLDVLGLIIVIAVPAGVGIMVTADLLVPVVLGPNWMDAIVLIQILALYGLCIAVQTNTGIMFVALGRPDLLSKLAGARSILLFLTLVLLTVRYGVVGAALAVAGSALLFLPINYYVLMKKIKVTNTDLVSVAWRPTVASALMAGLIGILQNQWVIAAGPSQLIMVVAIGVVAYSSILLGLWSLVGCPMGAERLLWNHAVRYAKQSLRKSQAWIGLP